MGPILVTGGTGTLGRHVVRRLREGGREARVLTRHTSGHDPRASYVTGDLLLPTGIDTAVEGVTTIIHCAGASKGDEKATENLVRAAARAGRPHVVFISVVGAERTPVSGRTDRLLFGYYDMKRKTEEIVASSGLPWTTLRASQFHDLVLMVAQTLARLPVVPVPLGIAFQPVDADEVAGRLVELALGDPAGLVPDMAGPQVHSATDLMRSYLQRVHKRRMLLPVWLPGKAARALRAGSNLAPERAIGTRTWEAFLAQRLPSEPPQREPRSSTT